MKKLLIILAITLSLSTLSACNSGPNVPSFVKTGNEYEVSFTGRSTQNVKVLEIGESGWIKVDGRYGVMWINIPELKYIRPL